jgi:hypothetical protein
MMIWDSPNITIKVLDCQSDTAEVFSKIDKYYMDQPKNSVANEWSVNNFGCTYIHCCLGMVTGITQDDPEEMDLPDDLPFKNYSMLSVK